MNGIPNELDLSCVVGELTTQVKVGRYDIQVSFGKVHFVVWAPIELFRDGKMIGSWSGGKWPSAAFVEIIDVAITSYEVPNSKLLVLLFENGVEMHLCDSFEQYESMSISVEGESGPWFI